MMDEDGDNGEEDDEMVVDNDDRNISNSDHWKHYLELISKH